eukprot:SAG31_NODE_2970_length_4839_cov_2.684810_7_plen_88_part_00
MGSESVPSVGSLSGLYAACFRLRAPKFQRMRVAALLLDVRGEPRRFRIIMPRRARAASMGLHHFGIFLKNNEPFPIGEILDPVNLVF